MKTYSEKLLDPRWQKKRLEVFERDCFICTCCGCHTRTIHVHHSKYTGDPWDAPLKDLRTVCSDCHDVLHDKITLEKIRNDLIGKLQRNDHAVVFILAAYMHEDQRQIAIKNVFKK